MDDYFDIVVQFDEFDSKFKLHAIYIKVADVGRCDFSWVSCPAYWYVDRNGNGGIGVMYSELTRFKFRFKDSSQYLEFVLRFGK